MQKDVPSAAPAAPAARTAAPSATVIVPTRPGAGEVPAVAAARRFRYAGLVEILVTRGGQPAIQRNEAIKLAQGDLVYFLDDDSVAGPDTLERGVAHFTKAAAGSGRPVVLVGGPNLCPKDAPALEQMFAVVLASGLAFGPSRARYAAVGEARDSSEKELILCNMLADRKAVIAAGMFDEQLYPNEENALMDGLQQAGRLVYDPEFSVERRPRPSKAAFRKMLLNYGRGRAEQAVLHWTARSLPNLVPAGFVAYLGLLPVWLWGCWVLGPLAGVTLLPLLAYLAAQAGQFAKNAQARGPGIAFQAAAWIFATHWFYGFGLLRRLAVLGWMRLSGNPFAGDPNREDLRRQVKIERIPMAHE